MWPRLIVGAVLGLIGAVWFGQGIGLIGGSFMSGHPLWAVIGAILLLAAAVLLRQGLRPPEPLLDDEDVDS